MGRVSIAINWLCASQSAPELLERDQPALRWPCEWGYRMQLRPRLQLLRRFALRSDREPVGPGSHPNLLESVLCSSRPLASAAKRPLGLRSEFVRSDHKNRIRNGIRNLYDSQVTTGIRLPERDSRASLVLFPGRQVGSVSAALPGPATVVDHAVGDKRVVAGGLRHLNVPLTDIA